MPRTADELLNTDDPAWPLLQQLLREAGPAARVLDANPAAGRREIESLQVSARSLLGATAHHVGAILIDSGWLRLLGCGHSECPWSISAATRALGWGEAPAPPEAILVGVDVLAGLFAINGGVLHDVPPGNVAYFAPDSLQWEDTDLAHSAWLRAMLDTDTRSAFYANLRWNAWQSEVAALPPNTGLHIYPPLFTRESRPIESTRRTAVPLDELVAATLDIARRLNA